MSSGQVVSVVVCSDRVPVSAIPTGFVCPSGQASYLVSAYLPFPESAASFESAHATFDSATGASFFGFGFGIVVFFWVLGLKSSLLLKPFWR